MKINLAHIVTAGIAVFSMVFALSFVITSRHTLLTVVCSETATECVLLDIKLIPSCLYLLSYYITQLIFIIIINIRRTNYGAKVYLWYSWCFLCNFMFITGAIQLTHLIQSKVRVIELFYDIEKRANFLQFIVYNMAKCVTNNLTAYVIGTGIVSMGFLFELLCFPINLRNAVIFTSTQLCYLLIELGIGTYSHLLTNKIQISDEVIGCICPVLIVGVYALIYCLNRKQKNKTEHSLTSPEAKQAIGLAIPSTSGEQESSSFLADTTV